MKHVFWLIPGILAGRSGPDREPWDLRELRDAGFGSILSVNDGLLCHQDDMVRAGIDYRCIPLSPNAPPQPGDLEHCQQALPRAFDFVTGMRDLGHTTLVHCSSGKDRTGLFMAYYLLRIQGLSPELAMAQVRAVRPIAFSAFGWEEFAREVLCAVAQAA